MTDLVLTWTVLFHPVYSTDKITVVSETSGVKESQVLGNLRSFRP